MFLQHFSFFSSTFEIVLDQQLKIVAQSFGCFDRNQYSARQFIFSRLLVICGFNVQLKIEEVILRVNDFNSKIIEEIDEYDKETIGCNKIVQSFIKIKLSFNVI